MMDNNEQQSSGVVDELRRRKVLRSTTIYSVTGWCILQLSDLYFAYIGWPDWAVTLVLTAVVLGFPVVVALSWAFDITPEGVRRSDPRYLPEPRRTSASYTVDGIVFLLFAATVTLLILQGAGRG